MHWLQRLLTIWWTIARYRLTDFIPQKKLRLKVFIFICALIPAKPNIKKQNRAVRLRLALQSLGPIHIKLGQLLSTRRDMLPEDVANELALLQDKVAPFPNEKSIAIIEHEFEKSIAQLFSQFEATPLASASVAQVHAATLHTGEHVVVKVIRPNIEKTIARDIKLLSFIAQLLEKLSSDARRFRLVEIISDYEQVIFSELDLKQEAANGSQLKRNFEEDQLSDILSVPAVYWDFSSEKVLVMERMYGVPVSNIQTLKDQQTDLKLLAERGVEIFFTQVFEHNFFHADMHPGNILVDINEPTNPRYIALDCAIMGSLPESDRYYTARTLLAALERDYRLVAKLYLESGWIKADTNAHAFESLIRSVCEPIFSKPLSELRVGTLLIYLFRAAKRFGMEVQPSLVLLQKTIVNVEGLGQQLYPELDLWQTAQPFLDKWVKERYSPKRLLNETGNRLPDLIESLPMLPDRLMAGLQQVSRFSEAHEAQLQKRIEQLESSSQKLKKFNVALLLITLVCLASYTIT